MCLFVPQVSCWLKGRGQREGVVGEGPPVREILAMASAYVLIAELWEKVKSCE
jgi:hypothetical protein